MKMAFVPLHQKVLYLCGLAVAGVLATGLLGAGIGVTGQARKGSMLTNSFMARVRHPRGAAVQG